MLSFHDVTELKKEWGNVMKKMINNGSTEMFALWCRNVCFYVLSTVFVSTISKASHTFVQFTQVWTFISQ